MYEVQLGPIQAKLRNTRHTDLPPLHHSLKAAFSMPSAAVYKAAGTNKRLRALGVNVSRPEPFLAVHWAVYHWG